MLTVVESDEFEIARGTKQGDLFSSSLFNSVLQSAMETDIGTWKEKSCGIQLGDEKKACISNLRFADDVFLLASSFNQLKKSKRCTEAQGLEIQPDKTKVLTSQESDTQKEFDIDEIQVAIFLLEGKSQVSGTADFIDGSRNYRNTAQNPVYVVARSPDTDRN